MLKPLAQRLGDEVVLAGHQRPEQLPLRRGQPPQLDQVAPQVGQLGQEAGVDVRAEGPILQGIEPLLVAVGHPQVVGDHGVDQGAEHGVDAAADEDLRVSAAMGLDLADGQQRLAMDGDQEPRPAEDGQLVGLDLADLLQTEEAVEDQEDMGIEVVDPGPGLAVDAIVQGLVVEVEEVARGEQLRLVGGLQVDPDAGVGLGVGLPDGGDRVERVERAVARGDEGYEHRASLLSG